MNILLTNDDGYQAPGILALKNALERRHSVYLCAPKRQMSATGHAITLFKPMELVTVSDRDHAVDGTPADCVKVALFHLHKDVRFDMVVSGVNDGPNMGDDIFYSGTVAGAREGAMNRIFSVAASLDGWNAGKDFSFPACLTAEIVDRLDPSLLTENIVLNINFPNIARARGLRVTHLGERLYKDFVTREDKDNKTFVTIAGDDPTFCDQAGSDLNAVSEGYVSITPMANEVFESRILDRIRFLENENWSCFSPKS